MRHPALAVLAVTTALALTGATGAVAAPRALDTRSAHLPTEPALRTRPQIAAASAPAVNVAWAPTVQRLAGADRYATAVEVSKAAYPSGGVPVAYVATGQSYPDGLAGAAAAGHEGGPLLLVTKDAIPAVVATELARLRPNRIVIQGGTGVISTQVANQLSAYASLPVERNAGTDRYDTAVKTALRAFPDGAGIVYIATGAAFPDALSASAGAANEGGPLLLVPGASIPASVNQVLDGLNATQAVIMGGPGSVSPQVERDLNGRYGTDNVFRSAGADRYRTGAVLGPASVLTADTALLATGANFPDALAGASLASVRQGSLYLTESTCVPQPVIDSMRQQGVSKVIVLGGTGTVSAAAAAMTPCALPAWLNQLNAWRANYGAPAVRESAWQSGVIAAHAHYLFRNGLDAGPEDETNEWFTMLGSYATRFGLVWRPYDNPAPDMFMHDPAEALWYLQPDLNVGGSYTGYGYVGLTVAKNAFEPQDPASFTWPMTWVSSRSNVSLRPLAQDWLSLTDYCPTERPPVYDTRAQGFLLSLGPTTPVNTASAKLTLNGVVVPTCIAIDKNISPTSLYADWLPQALALNNSVMVIPTVKLNPGRYTLTTTVNGISRTNSFTIS